MYKIPEDMDLSPLIGQNIENVEIGPYSINGTSGKSVGDPKESVVEQQRLSFRLVEAKLKSRLCRDRRAVYPDSIGACRNDEQWSML